MVEITELTQSESNVTSHIIIANQHRIIWLSSIYKNANNMKILFLLCSIYTVVKSFAPAAPARNIHTSDRSSHVLYGKKKKGGGGGGKPRGGQQQQEKQSVKDARFDAATRSFMFTLVGLTKMLPDKSKKILDNIHLSFYPGAKIGTRSQDLFRNLEGSRLINSSPPFHRYSGVERKWKKYVAENYGWRRH